MPPADKLDQSETAPTQQPYTEPQVSPQVGEPAGVPPVVVAPIQPARPSLKDRILGGGKKKTVILAVLVGVLMLGGGASAYYLGVVVPNQPENLWQTALERTAKGYDSLVQYSQDTKDLKGAQLKGDYKLEGEFATDGTFEAHTYEGASTFKADIGIVGSRVNFEGRVIPASNSSNPDIYFKASGLKGLAGLEPSMASLAEQYENKWLSIDHTLFDNLESMALKEGSTGQQASSGSTTLTSEDFNKIAETVGKVNREYIFTTDQSKAVLTVVKQVGKEDRDNHAVYHYQVGLHKQHTKDYLNTMVDSLQNTPVTKLTEGRKLRDVIDMNDLLKSVDEYKESDVAHVYVDMKTKLIRTVRLEDTSNSKSYVELTQDYAGGDVVPFTLRWHDDTDGESSSLQASFNLNKKTNVADGNVALEAPGSDKDAKKTKLSMKYTLTRQNDKVDVQKPEGAQSIYELIGPLMSQYLTATPGQGDADVDLGDQVDI